MYVRLQRLACLETEDSTGADEAYINYDGQRVWGPVKINDGQSREIGIVRRLGQGRVDVFDEDSPDADDHLGTIDLIGPSEPREGSFSRDFGRGCEYTLFWDILDLRGFTLAAAHSGKVLDVADASKDDSAPLVQFDWHFGRNQLWHISQHPDGTNTISSVNSGKVLDVGNASLDDSAPIIQFQSHGGDNQRWRMQDAGGGFSMIIAVHSGKALDVASASLDNGAPIIQFASHGGDNQRWQITPA